MVADDLFLDVGGVGDFDLLAAGACGRDAVTELEEDEGAGGGGEFDAFVDGDVEEVFGAEGAAVEGALAGEDEPGLLFGGVGVRVAGAVGLDGDAGEAGEGADGGGAGGVGGEDGLDLAGGGGEGRGGAVPGIRTAFGMVTAAA